MGITASGMGRQSGPTLSALPDMVKPQQRELDGTRDMMVNAGREMRSPAGQMMMQSIPGLVGAQSNYQQMGQMGQQQMNTQDPRYAAMIAQMLRDGTGTR